MSDHPETLYLIDGYNLIFRSYFAFIKNPLKNLHNQNRSAVFGFFRTISLVVRSYAPRYLLVALDSIEPSFRHLAYDQYKGTRDKSPEDLISQIPLIEEILHALEIASVRVSGFEADDVIATLATRCAARQQPCRIISTDKDLLQLVNSTTAILRPAEGGFKLIDETEVVQSRGVEARRVLDLLALCGDSADNIPGVAGVGPKSAVRLIGTYGGVDEIYAHLNTVEPPAVRAKLEANRENALLSKKLVALEYAVPIPEEYDQPLLRLNSAHAAPLFQRENMQALSQEYRRIAEGSPRAGAGDERASDDADAALEALSEPARPHTYTLIEDIATLKTWVAAARAQGVCALDCETDNTDPMQATPIGFSLCHEVGKACYIPLRGPQGALLPPHEVREALRPLLEDAAVSLVGHNIKYDYKVMKRWGLTLLNITMDSMIAAWVLDTTANRYSLDTLAHRYLNYRPIPFPERAKKEGFDALDIHEATEYAAEDADITLSLTYLLVEELKKNSAQWELYQRVEMPLVPILAEMEYRGIALNVEALAAYSKELSADIDTLKAEIHTVSNRTFNINSPKQLQKVLFEDLKLTPVKKTKSGYSTDNAVLTLLSHYHALPQLVLRYRQLAKLRSTYLEALPLMVNNRTGRVHTTFNLNGTATGRISSTDPNLQNIPVKDEEGRKIRSAFTAQEGHLFISADYSQIELMLLTHQSGDPILTHAFKTNQDVHQLTASLIFGVAPEEVTDTQRSIGKTINFGVMYGMSAFRLSRELQIPQSEARQFIDNYFKTYTGVANYIQATLQLARQSGVVTTLLGRRRSVEEINNRNRVVQQGAERIAVNTPIQGSAADIIKVAMINIHRRLKKEGLKGSMLLQVHDEIIVEAPHSEQNAITAILKEEMEGAYTLSLPLQVHISSGTHWGQLK